MSLPKPQPACPMCGADVPKNSDVCSECGNELPIILVDSEPSPSIDFPAKDHLRAFHWIAFAGENKLRSDAQAVAEANDIGRYLLREFSARLKDWRALYERERIEVNSYLETARVTASKGRIFSPPPLWQPIHRIFSTYLNCKSALADELWQHHPSSRFCTLHPIDSSSDLHYVFCKGMVWTSREWLSPRAWFQRVDEMLSGDSSSKSV
jgi:hypothetical protein